MKVRQILLYPSLWQSYSAKTIGRDDCLGSRAERCAPRGALTRLDLFWIYYCLLRAELIFRVRKLSNGTKYVDVYRIRCLLMIRV